MKDIPQWKWWRIRLRQAVALFCMAASLLLSSSLSGAEVNGRKTVRIPCSNFSRLMVVDDHRNPVSGYAYDYIQAIATYAKWNVEYVYCDGFAECVEKLLSGEVDLFYDVSYTEERAQVILYPDEPMGTESYWLYASGSNDSISPGDYSTMDGKAIGVTSGTIQIDFLEHWRKKRDIGCKVVEYRTIPDKEAALASGEIDMDLEVSMLARRNFSAIEKVGTSPYYLVANKGRPDLIEDINAALDKLLSNDLYYLTRLEERYFYDTVLSHNLTFEEKSWIEAHKTLRVGFFDKYLPFSALDKDGNPTGVGIETIRRIVHDLKLEDSLEVEFVCYTDQEKGMRAVESGEIDLMFPAYVSNLVKQDFHIVGGKTLATLSCDVVYHEDRWDGKIDRISVNRRNLMQYYYSKDVYPDAEIVYCDGINGCLDALLEGAADVTFLNGFRSDALLKPSKYRPLSAMRAKNDFTFRMAFAEDNIELMLLMDRGATMLEPDFVNKASYSYVGKIYSYSVRDFLWEHVRLVATVIAILAALVAALVGYRVSNRKLAGMNRELKEYSETIERQRRQEAGLRERLEEALRMAQASSRAKTTFLSNMSHDIRTPMNAIIGFTSLAADNIGDSEHVRECLSTISQSSEYLLSLINDVLDMSRIESGKVTLNEKTESLSDIIDGLRDIVRADVQTKRHDFSIDASDVRNDIVRCDRMRLNQVLLNLVSNAIKYTNPGGRISLRVIQKPSAKTGCGTYEFHVRDNGIGIDEEFSKTIFDPFTREQDSTVSGIQGTGLGMAIAKNLVELMGGSISVASKKGEGSEFTVSVEFKFAEREKYNPDGGGGAEQPFSLRGKRILLVDDSTLNLKVGALLLKRQGVDVDTAPDGQAAIDKIREKGVDAYDFVLMDVQMPGMDGYGATARIRALPGGDRVKIIAFSANAFAEDREKSIQAGMDGHIAKPLKIDELVNELSRFA